ncbi:Mu transposase C-terminal domain-containing protein [Paraburkholderia aspalathi]|uniref:Mu transposase C-terminal domain-containing protein n=1 Tax=Paraburkholderia aspalathi TaxID=1324617 RepID=UPI001FC9E6D5|nr:Mu transposase C-terminal domain-containing protein [Paraburkholderia aspalathi]
MGNDVDKVIDEVVHVWLPKQRQLAHPATDLVLEVRRRCALAGLQLPSRTTIGRRWAKHRESDALKRAALPDALKAPGSLVAKYPLEIVQVDHTQADVLLVSEYDRRVIGRPWLTLALDVATRCVLSFYVSMDRPGAATVGLLMTRAALCKAPWLAKIEVDGDWPMRGIPQVLHLDNAAEFKSRALRSGCREYGIDLMYPVGRPHFGGHIERPNRTLMERVRGLPGATASSPKGHKARQSEKTAALTLREFEQWLAIEVARRYHHAAHHGLLGATPAGMWRMQARSADSRQLPATGGAALRFLIRFLPAAQRTIQAYGLTFFHIRYWHPIFVAWREARRTVTVRYHPEDLSRVFVTAGTRDYLEVQYADMRRPAISPFEQRTALKAIRSEGQQSVSEALIFRTVEEQRRLIANARRTTVSARRRSRRKYVPLEEVLERVVQFRSETSEHEVETVDYDAPVQAFDVEQW